MDYKAAYFHLYGEVAFATEELQRNLPEKALARLVRVQLELEERYMDESRKPGIAMPKPKKPPKR